MPTNPTRSAKAKVPRAVKRRGWAMLTKTGRIEIMEINLDRDFMAQRGILNDRKVIPVSVLITPIKPKRRGKKSAQKKASRP